MPAPAVAVGRGSAFGFASFGFAVSVAFGFAVSVAFGFASFGFASFGFVAFDFAAVGCVAVGCVAAAGADEAPPNVAGQAPRMNA
ncbi:MAG: hypothetical protein KC486_24315, partial [Myxococcales bacterium]|nr:hypothetical protein [Myxococcales bacterium]